MFERPHHQRIAALLQRFDASVLAAHACWFGGGTAIALRHGEYRESRDVDFLVSDAADYRQLRSRVSVGGLDALLPEGAPGLDLVRAPRIDADGIRTWVRQDGVELKVEIIREARIRFDAPGPRDAVCGIASLTPCDLAASKMLANVDRGLDDATFNRDLIDLAMMRAGAPLLRDALSKAAMAYGEAEIRRHLSLGAERLRRAGWAKTCLDTMAMAQPPAVLGQAIRTLLQRLGPGRTG